MMILTLDHVLSVSTIVFGIGTAGLIAGRKSVITLLMAIELMLLAVNINLVAFSTFHQNTSGQLFTFFILTVAAAEAAIGLAILVVYYRHRGLIDVDDISTLKG